MSKEQERAELHRTIWAIANDLRGSVDGWDFKNYILGFLFYRFISEDLTAHLNATEEEAGNEGFNYATDVTDEDIDEEIRKQTIEEKGYFIYPSELFQNVATNAEGNEDLNITLAKIFKNIEGSAIGTESEQDMKGLFSDIDVNSPKLGATTAKRNELLGKIMLNIRQMNLGGDLRDAQIDAFGDAYEFLMTMYASNAGKSGGEFFTPQEVAELLARIACDGKNRITKVYDPACGSGSLLLKFAKVLGQDKAKQVSFYGQELNITTYNLCRINMFLHHVPFNQFDIQLGDTLIEPKHLGEIPFDAIVSNPPYSTKWVGDDNPLLINDDRFSPAGVLAPKAKADLAFTMHILYNLATTGTAAIVEFPGVLYRGGAEQKIRHYLVENNYVDSVIQLPENLFFGVSIATCIIVLKKSKRDNNILFINASEEFVKDGNKNKLTEENILDIVSYYKERSNINYKTYLASNLDVLANDSNLAVSSYVKKEDTREKIVIEDVNQQLNIIDNEVDIISAIINESICKGISVDEMISEMCPNGIKYRKLKDIGIFYTGLSGKSKEDFSNGNALFVTYSNIFNNPSLDVNVKDTVVVNEGEQQNEVKYGDILFTGSSETPDEAGMSSVVLEEPKEKMYLNSFCFGLRLNDTTEVLPAYMRYVLRSNKVREAISMTAFGVTRFNINKKKFAEIAIPIPPVNIQEKVVSILDSFTKLKSLLLQQSELRNKQYQYYSEQLLTFE